MLNIYAYKGKNGTMEKYQDFEFPETATVDEITSNLIYNGFVFTVFDVLNAIVN